MCVSEKRDLGYQIMIFELGMRFNTYVQWCRIIGKKWAIFCGNNFFVIFIIMKVAIMSKTHERNRKKKSQESLEKLQFLKISTINNYWNFF